MQGSFFVLSVLLSDSLFIFIQGINGAALSGMQFLADVFLVEERNLNFLSAEVVETAGVAGVYFSFWQRKRWCQLIEGYLGKCRFYCCKMLKEAYKNVKE